MGHAVFFATMFAFFQVIFTVAAPLQDAVQGVFDWLGSLVTEYVSNGWLASFLGDALIGGVGGVLVFLPQIALLFLMISLLEGSGYISRAAFLMDRLMAKAGLEGRAFVALLSSLACAIPGIMATRTLPSARDRFATMMGAPLMTCSARLPVYVLLIGLLVSPGTGVGPFGAQGLVMFGLYLVGALSAMATAWCSSNGSAAAAGRCCRSTWRCRPTGCRGCARWPSPCGDACKGFLRKVGGIILLVTVALWLLLSLPMRGDANSALPESTRRTRRRSPRTRSTTATPPTSGKPWSPSSRPSASTGGSTSACSARCPRARCSSPRSARSPRPEPGPAGKRAVTDGYTDGPRQGEKLFTPAMTAALLVFFLYALQCMSTIGGHAPGDRLVALAGGRVRLHVRAGVDDGVPRHTPSWGR